jgi:hypothetical protein
MHVVVPEDLPVGQDVAVEDGVFQSLFLTKEDKSKIKKNKLKIKWLYNKDINKENILYH